MGYKPNRSPIFKAVQIFTTCVRDLLAMNRSILKALGVASVGLGAWYWLGLTRWQSLAASAAVYLITGGWRFTKVVILTLPRDAGALVGLIKIRFRMKMLQKSNKTMIDIFDDTVAKHPHKIALIMANGKEWTFAEVQRYSYQIANWIRHEGYQPGDCVALFMMGCPEYVCWWLGMARVSVIPALINFNLRNESLVHCINVAEAKAVIYGTELAAAIQDIQGSISGLALYNVGPNVPSPGYNIEDSVAQMSLETIPSSLKPNNHDRLFYIFTSGTTGLPKAAIIKHYRFYYMVYGSGLMFGITPSDRIYDTLPLYHSAGGVLGIGQMIVRGCTIIVRPKFSASQYWTDCIKYQATAGQYIGEICRYLLAQPLRPTDAQHQVKRIYGNGIRPQIWKEFQQRFNVPNIVEFYGATEGNSNVVNYLGKVGAIGFTTRILPFLYPVSLIRVDTETGEPLRDRTGLCVHCNPGEAGELVGKISNTQIRRFDGYVGSQDKTKKKITHNVFKHGDQAFLTGDILEMDEYGYFYFKDRSGDTFRWKGENVSTLEVEGILHNVVEYRDAVVFGVEIPGNEGRAGMAAIANDHGLDLQHVYHQLQLRLPAYARPVIIRLLDEVDKTATFKLKKKKYVEEGFNPFEVKDSLYYLDARQGMYVPIDGNVYEQICTGKIRL